MPSISMFMVERETSCYRWELAYNMARYLIFYTYKGLEKIKLLGKYEKDVVGLVFPLIFADQEAWFEEHKDVLVAAIERGFDSHKIGHTALYNLEANGRELITYTDCIHQCMKAEEFYTNSVTRTHYTDLSLFIVYNSLRGLMNILDVEQIKIVR